MRSSIVIPTIIALLACFASVSWALMPPMDADELERDSTNIVRGKILSVECTGEFDETGCAVKTGYVAKLAVKRNIKGKLPKTVDLRFKMYDFKEGCVGSPDTLHFPGEEATYYLRCRETGCRLTHWNGIENRRSGPGSLPACRKKGSPKD